MTSKNISFILLIAALFSGGCTGLQPSPYNGPRMYSVNDSGILSLGCQDRTVHEYPAGTPSGYNATKLVFQSAEGQVYAILIAPEHPKAAFIHVPGAGVKKEDHLSRAVIYANHGFAYLAIDPRGNGGETPGYLFSLETDYRLFEKGEPPQYYEIICDLIAARKYLMGRFGIPVYSSGESNGGRYALIAAAIDEAFAGYAGISTSGFERAGDRYEGDARRFLLSVDPDVYAAMISPRPVWIFHASGDTIIPIEDGRRLYEMAREPKQFITFNGTHGVNGEVDDRLIVLVGQFYPAES
jgi:fermentation-respiration switch protein FrsA (DUF1100 family)